MAFAEWLTNGRVVTDVYAANGGGINFTNVEGTRWHFDNFGKIQRREER